MNKFYIKRNHIKASLHCAKKGDDRLQINGVLFDATSNQAMLVSTNGHLLSVLRVGEVEDDFNRTSVIIPIDAIKTTLKLNKNETIPLSPCDDGEDKGKWLLGEVVFTPIGTVFPSYKKVIPMAVNGKAGNYSSKYLKKATKVLRDFYDVRKVEFPLFQNGEKNVAIMQSDTNNKNAIVLIMPVVYNENSIAYIPMVFE